MSNSPKISVIVPVCNAGEFLTPLLDSVLNQSMRDFELICIDDGSTDDSLAILETTAKQDERIVVLHQDQKGPGCARNLGMNAAKGTYISFVDADDLVHPKMLEQTYEAAVKGDADIVIVQSQHLCMETGQVQPSPDAWDATSLPSVLSWKDLPDTLYSTFKNWPWDKLFKRSFIEANNVRFPPLRRTEDLPFTCKALTLAERIVPLNQVLYTYRVMNPSSSTQTLDRAPVDFIRACELLKEFLDTAGMFENLKVSYLNWTALCIRVNLYGMKTIEGFNEAYTVLHEGSLEKLGLSQSQSSLFEDERYEQVLSVIKDYPCDKGVFELWHLEQQWHKIAESRGLMEHLRQSIDWQIKKRRCTRIN